MDCMVTVERFREELLAQVEEFTYRWWTDRSLEEQNFFYHVDDTFYEEELRAEAAELLELIFAACLGDRGTGMDEWAKRCSAKRALQEVPAEEAVERFRMFRRVLHDSFTLFAERERLGTVESLRIAEMLTNQCELAMQLFMTHYMSIQKDYLDEQKKRSDIERLASIGEMAAGVAHEVRNPLTATRGFLQLLAEERPHRFLEIAMQELDRGIRTIATLLDVAKPNAPLGPLKQVSLCDLMQGVVELFQDKLYSVELRYEFEDLETRVEGREETLKQAFFNVILNAIEAMQDREERRLILRHKRAGDQVIVEVEDSGRGISKEKLPLLGTPFFTMKDNGVGLGLTMVYRTMHEHYAQVTVESEPMQGTRFRFTFSL